MTDINTFVIDYNNKVISDKLDIAYLRLNNQLNLDNNIIINEKHYENDTNISFIIRKVSL